jgi:hypothetical protein
MDAELSRFHSINRKAPRSKSDNPSRADCKAVCELPGEDGDGVVRVLHH